MGNENLDTVMQQLAEQMREYNENLSRYARASSNTEKTGYSTFSSEEIKKLTDSLSNLKNLKVEELNALKNELSYRGKLTKAIEEQIDAEILRNQQIKANSAATVNLIKGIYNLRDAVDDISGDLTKFNGTLKGLGDGALELGKLYGKKGIILGGTIKALTVFTEITLKQTNSLLKAFDSLSEIGGTTNITTGQIRELGAAAGYSVANLDKFLKPIKSLGLDIGLLGSTAAQGVQTFSKMAAVGNETYRAYNRLGISQEELTEAQARFIKQSANVGTQLSKSPMALQKASLEYLDTLVQLRDLHGISIKQQQDALDIAKNNDNFNTYMLQKRMQRAEIEKQIESTNDPVVKKQLEERAAEITQIIKNKEAYATYATSTYDAAQAARLLQSISTDGAAIYTESNKELALQDRNLNDLNRTLVTSKDVNAGINLEREQNAKATKQLTQNLGVLASGLGSQSSEINKTFGISNEMRNATVRNYEMTTEAGRKRIEEEQAQAKANIERRKKEGEIVDANGNIVRDTAKDVQNVLLTVNRKVATFKDAVIAAVNPFTGSIIGAIAGISAFTFAAYKAAKMLKSITGMAGPSVSAPGTPTPGAPSGGGRLARIGGFAKGVLRKAGPIAAIMGAYDAAQGFTADPNAGFGSKLMNAGSSALHGMSFGMLGSSPEEIKKRAQLSAGKLGDEATTSTAAEGGQKAVNVNIVGSTAAINVNIEKVLDPLFRMAQTSGSGQRQTAEPMPAGISAPSSSPNFGAAPATGGTATGGTATGGTATRGEAAGGAAAGGTGNSPPLESVVNKKDSSVNLDGLNPNFEKNLAMMASDFKNATGQKIQVNSAFRDPKEQAELFRRDPTKAAPPGRSNHERGLALDMNSINASVADSMGLFDKYSLGRPVRGEPWHVEPKGARSPKDLPDSTLVSQAGNRTTPQARPASGAQDTSSYSQIVGQTRNAQGQLLVGYTRDGSPIWSNSAGGSGQPSVADAAARTRDMMQSGSGEKQAESTPAAPTTAAPVSVRSPVNTSSSDDYRRIAGERFIPGQPLSRKQMAVISLSLSSGNTYPPEVMEQYNKQKNQPVPAGDKSTGPSEEFAQGGMISGPGTSTSDSIPAFNRDTGQPIALSTGEYVLPASVTSMLGRGYLDSLISSPNTLKRQSGGSIPGEDGQKVISAAVDLGEGMREIIYSDGSRELSGGFGTRFFDPSGKLVKTRTPNFAGLSKDIYADGTEDAHYSAGPLNVSKYASGRTSASYNAGMAKLYADTEQGMAIDIFNEDRTERVTSMEQINTLLEQYKNDDGSDMKTMLELFKELFQTMMDKNESLFGEMNSTLKDVVGELETSNSTQEDILNYSRI